VKITKPFYLSVNEVTQQQYEKVMGTRPWEGNRFVRDGPDYPATYVSHDAAVEFCRKLSEQEGVEYRLPTEAQWEYACRAETSTPYSYGDDASKLEQYTWYYTNASSIGESYAHRVGQKPPNPWGLFDMHGNVWEWCGDWYGDYDGATVDDPRRPSPSCLAALANGSSYIGRLGETLFRANREQFMANNHSETERRLWDAADEFRANSDLKSSGAKGGMGVHDPVIGTLGIIGN
jgi:formylglycine-generating enzyme required for sulfatase activity